MEVGRTEGEERVQRGLAFQDQTSEIEALTGGQEGTRLFDPVSQEQQRPGVIAAAGVMEPDPDLQDALVEPANRTPLGMPLVLQLLVRLVVLAAR